MSNVDHRSRFWESATELTVMGNQMRHLRSTLASYGDVTSSRQGGSLHDTFFHWISFSKNTLFKTSFCEHFKCQVTFVSTTFPFPNISSHPMSLLFVPSTRPSIQSRMRCGRLTLSAISEIRPSSLASPTIIVNNSVGGQTAPTCIVAAAGVGASGFLTLSYTELH